MPPWLRKRSGRRRKFWRLCPPSITQRSRRRFAAAADELKLKTGQMFQPIRVAVCGRKNAPPLFETLEVLGRDTVLTRLDFALGLI